jgi:hypothetical protein
MKNETIKLLAAQMDAPPDEIIDLDRSLCEHEADMPDSLREALDKTVTECAAILSDETLAFGVKLGYVFTHIARGIASSTGVPQSHVFMGAAKQCLEYERIESIQEAVIDLLEGNIPEIMRDDPPFCPECDSQARWCNHHRCWECPNPTCIHDGEIERGE